MGLQQTLKALSDPIRREILNLLKKGRMPAGEITAHFSVSAPAILQKNLLCSSCIPIQMQPEPVSSNAVKAVPYFFRYEKS